MELKECKIHGMTEHSIRKDSGTLRCKKCIVDSVQKRRKELKLKAILYKGGKCERCNYSKCYDALDFHHLDPNTKEFGISKVSTPSWDRLKKEVDKCILLCANCHREEHAKLNKITE